MNLKNLKYLQLGDNALVGYRLASLMRSEGYSVDYIHYFNKSIEAEKQPWAKHFKGNPIKLVNKYQIVKQILSISEEYDLIHAHNIFGIPLLNTDSPIVLHLHGSDIRIYAKQINFIGILLKKLIAKANAICVATPDILCDVKNLGRKGYFIPNPIDFTTYKPSPKKVDLLNGADYSLFHPSRHTCVKRNNILIQGVSDVLSQGYNIMLTMIEWGDRLQESKRLIQKLGIEEHINWIKPIPFDKMSDYYNACDIVCDQYYIQGGLGLVTLEAMACSKPVITLYDPSNFKTGYLVSPPLPTINNNVDLVGGLVKMIEDDYFRRQIGNECLKWVTNEHSQTRIRSSLSEVYNYALTGDECCWN